MESIIKTNLGQLTLPPTPKPASTLTDYQQAVSVWTRQVEQTFKRFEKTLINLDTAQIPQAPAGGGGGVYYTDALARAAISSTAPILYNNVTGVISLDIPLAVQYGGTGVTTFGGTNRVLFTTAADTLSSSANILWSEADLTLTVTETIETNNIVSDSIQLDGLSSGNRLVYANAFKSLQSAAVTAPLDFTTGTLSIQLATHVLVGRGASGTGAAQSLRVNAPLEIGVDGTGPFLGITQADNDTDGYLTFADWNTFNGKQPGDATLTALAGLTTAQGDLIYATGVDAFATLAKDTNATRYLSNSGASNNPAWAQVSLTNGITGTLPVGNGGTGVTTFGGTNRLLYTTTTDTLSSIATANTSALVTSSTGAPSWTSGGTANRVLRTDGTTVSFAQVALGTDVTGTLGATLGGTGQSSVTTGDLLYGSATNTWSKLAGVATGNALISGGVTTAPSWGKIGLTTHVSGTLAVGNGGTGATTFTAGRVLFGNGSSALSTDSNFFWDNSTKALGLGNAPAARLDVKAAGTASMAKFWTDQSDSYVFITNNTNGSDYGFFGIRGGQGGFFQSFGAFRIEAGGGGLYYLLANGITLGTDIGLDSNSALHISNNTTYAIAIDNGDDTSTPGNPLTPVGWIKVIIDGNQSYLPYYQ